jgi:hypothetical protein
VDVDDEDVRILRSLAKAAPLRLTQDQIEAESGVSRRTIYARMPSLLAASLVAQPKGPKSGTTITPAGIDLLKKLHEGGGAKLTQ